MQNNYKFQPSKISEEVQKKLFIARLPEWMQNVEQIQKFSDDIIQQWLNPVEEDVIDGYIGDIGSPAAAGKIFLKEKNVQRQMYQLSPVYASRNADNSINTVQFYDDLVNYFKLYGVETSNQDRLFSAKYYAWTPPINPNKLQNFGSYVWDNSNEYGIAPDYVVMERGSIDGNTWSLQNFWYTVGQKLSNGVVLTDSMLQDSRFVRAQAPIIEFNKNIELMNYGTDFRGVVDYLSDTVKPEDIVQRSVSDNIKIDGFILKNGDRILFTSIGNSGENNRIYKVYVDQQDDGSRVYGLALDEDEFSSDRPTGEPKLGDVVLIKNGVVYKNVTVYWNGTDWIRAQEKPSTNVFPKFKLFDRTGVNLGDSVVYPGNDFNGSNLFGFKINFDYNLDKIYNAHVELNEFNYYVFENFLQSQRFSYDRLGVKTEIPGLYYYSVREEGNSFYLKTDWVRSEEESKQFVKQVPEITKISLYKIFNTLRDMNTYSQVLPNMDAYVIETDSYYKYIKNEITSFYSWVKVIQENIVRDTYNREFELAQKIDSSNVNDLIEVYVGGELTTNYSTIKTGNFIQKIILDDTVAMSDTTICTIRTYSENIVPDLNLGAYEIPLNMQYNPYNENVVYVDQSEYTLHMYDIIASNITSGSVSGFNDYENVLESGNVNNSTGKHIIQNEASFLPMMLSTANKNLDLFESCTFVQNEYFRFKNKFNTILVDMYKKNPDLFNTETPSNIVDLILARINQGKDNTFPFYIDAVGSNTTTNRTFIPPTAQFLGILKAFTPEKNAYLYTGRDMISYNIDHTGAVSKSYKAINGAAILDDVIFELENRIYQSIDISFKDVDYVPLLTDSTLKNTMYFKNAEYSNVEYNNLLLRGYINFIASKNISNETHEFDANNWMTWNFLGSTYSNNGEIASGSWRAVYTYAYGTYRPYSHPWEMLGFSRRPEWFNQEYEPTKVQVGKSVDDFIYVYTTYVENEQGDLVSTGLWDSTDGLGDVSTGTIRYGSNTGSYPEFVRFGIQPFNIVDTSEISDNNLPIKKIELISPMDLGILTGSLEHRAEPWSYGDMGEMEFTYMNTALFSFDCAMALYRAKPAMFSNYFLDTKNNTLMSVYNSDEKQFLYGGTRLRTNFNDKTIVHSEDNARVLGYQAFISNYLIYQNKNITTNFGDILRASHINVGHKIGGFTKADQLTFKSDAFGLISQENQHIGLVNSVSSDEEVLSSIKIVNTGNGYTISGYDLIGGIFKAQVPNKLGKRTSVQIGTQMVTHYNEYKNSNEVVEYGTLFKNVPELYNFICAYGEYLKTRGWIFEDMTSDGTPNNWDTLAKEFVEWTQTKPKTGQYISISPSSSNAKFGSTFGSVLSITQFSGGVWSLMDDQNNGIRSTEIDTARIGNVFSVRTSDDSEKRIALIRLHLNSFEHSVVFDDRTIFGDDIYIPLFGSIFEMLQMYGYVTANWNGRLESNGFIILEQGTLPNFEKLVTDFKNYYDPDALIDNNTIQDLSRHLIGYQTRNYINQMITSENSQVDFYRGFIKEKGTNAAFEKVLRVSKTYNTDNYKALQEWAFKIGTYGNIDGKKHLQFKLMNDEILQEPQLFVFDEQADSSVIENTSYIQYYGEEGTDSRWITRPKGNFKFPTRFGNSEKINLPNIGPVTLPEVSYSTLDFASAYVDRNKFTANTGKIPTSVWMFRDTNSTWNIFELTNTNKLLVEINPIEDDDELAGTHCELVLDSDHGLVDGDYFYFIDTSEYMPDLLNEERQYFSAGTLNTIVIPLELANSIVFSDNEPVLYKYSERYTSSEKEQYVIDKMKYGAVESSLFARPSTYNENTNITELYLNVYDPINGVIPGSIMSNIDFVSTNDPALYNSYNTTIQAWGSEKVGDVWWDTSNAFFLDYNIPILDSNGEVDTLKTLEYKRTNWGKLLSHGSIDVYEWVASPVLPFDWERYCDTQSKLNKGSNSWVPSGEADFEDYSEFQEYNSNTGTYSTVYYFWVKNTIYLPKINTRTKSTMELAKAILNPLVFNTPWFAPIDGNAFIISGIQREITDDKSIFTIEYTEDATEVVKHEQYQLCREGEEYNFNKIIWNSMWDSLRSSSVLDNGNTVELKYPQNELGIKPNQIWFEDVLEARREYVYSSNDIFRTKNMITNTVVMNEIFNVKTEEVNPNLVQVKVLSFNNELVIVPNEDKFVENDAVLVNTSGTLPDPLSASNVYFVHFDDNGYIRLMNSPSSSNSAITITLTSRGEGAMTMIKQSDYIEALGTSLDMTNYWTLADWYNYGFNSSTSYTSEPSLDIADLKNYQEGDIVRVIDSEGLWTLYQRQFSRNIPVWTAIGREKSTIALNNNIFSGYEQYNSDGTPTNTEINVRKALTLLQGAYDGFQSPLVFDLVKYVHVEQTVVDWVFKTSYIFILGLDQTLQKNYIQNDNLINQIVEYFEEVKPYRTKIRSQIEQKTSDEDQINGLLNDLDPNGYILVDGKWIKSQTDIWDHEYAVYNNSTNKWEAVGSLPSDFVTPNRRFQEMNTVLVFDNTQCIPNTSYARTELEEINNRYTSQNTDTLTENTQYKLQRFKFDIPVLDISNINTSILISLNAIYSSVDINGDIQVEINKLFEDAAEDLVLSAQIKSNVEQISNTVYNTESSCIETAKFVQYGTLSNRLDLYTQLSTEEIEVQVNCPFKGKVLTDNTNTRLPVGFSSSNSYNLGYALSSIDLYDKLFAQASTLNPTFTSEELMDYMAINYGLYSHNYDMDVNGRNYRDSVMILSVMRNNLDKGASDPYAISEQIINSLNDINYKGIVLIPRELARVRDINTQEEFEIPFEYSIEEFMEQKFTENGSVLELIEINLDDIGIDSSCALYTEIQDVVNSIVTSPYYNDINAFDNVGLETQYKEIINYSSGVATYDTDPVFIDISSLNASASELSNIKLSVSGYSYDTSGNSQLKESGRFQIEGFVMMNPYNRQEAIISIPKYNEAIEYMDKDILSKAEINYVYHCTDVVTLNGAVKIKNTDGLNVGDTVMVFTPENKDLQVQLIDGTWETILSVSKIKDGNKPKIFYIGSTNQGEVSLYEDDNGNIPLMFDNLYESNSDMYMNHDTPLSLNIVRVSSFADVGFSEGGINLYSTSRSYRISLLDYDVFYDRILDGSKYNTTDFDVEYISNESITNSDGVYIDYGYNLPNYGSGALSEKVRSRVTDNLQITVLEYVKTTINPVFDGTTWTYTGTVVDDVYINDKPTRLTNLIIDSSEPNSTVMVKPLFVEDCSILNNTFTSTNSSDEMYISVNSEIILLNNDKKMLGARMGTCSQYYEPNVTYNDSCIVLGNETNFVVYLSGSDPIGSAEFYNSKVISGSLIEKVIK